MITEKDREAILQKVSTYGTAASRLFDKFNYHSTKAFHAYPEELPNVIPMSRLNSDLHGDPRLFVWRLSPIDLTSLFVSGGFTGIARLAYIALDFAKWKGLELFATKMFLPREQDEIKTAHPPSRFYYLSGSKLETWGYKLRQNPNTGEIEFYK